MSAHLVVFAKNPVPGSVKTRLTGALTPRQAADLYRAFLRDIIAQVDRIPVDVRVLAFAPANAREALKALAPPDWHLTPQADTDLGGRMAAVAAEQFRAGAERVVIIGTDGGYYLVGLSHPSPAIFDRIDWSTEQVFRQSIDRIRSAGLSLDLLPPWYDVDTPDALGFLHSHLDAARTRLEDLQKAGGYTAFKSGPPGKWRGHEPPAVVDAFVKCAYTMREWVGPEAELAFDFHGKMTPALAVEICHEIRGMRPMFVEEPVPQENVDALKQVTDKVPYPIATGERLLTRWDFREILEKGAAAYLQPDVSHTGGITELKKICNMAEVYYVHTMPHCAIGPVAFTASMHVDAAVPNFLIQEQIDQGLGAGLFRQPWQVREGHIDLPTAPGLGFEIDEEEAQKNLAVYQEELGGEHFYESDGSVADW